MAVQEPPPEGDAPKETTQEDGAPAKGIPQTFDTKDLAEERKRILEERKKAEVSESGEDEGQARGLPRPFDTKALAAQR